MKFIIRSAKTTDLEAVLALNESEVPQVGRINLQDTQNFLDKALYFRVVCDEAGQIVAFLIGLDPDTEYNSPNFQWFCSHRKKFAYVDRIAVAKSVRRNGIAETLYEDFEDVTREWAECMCCEVNIRPENPASMAFHERLGFAQVGSLESNDGAKKVAMLVKEFD
jgi:predicted GNAT superfamily acetyltransferase